MTFNYKYFTQHCGRRGGKAIPIRRRGRIPLYEIWHGGSAQNLSDYVNSGLEIKDNMLKLWQLGNLPQKKRVQTMIFPDGLVYDKKNDDIEPLSKNEFMFVFDLKSVGYEEKEKGQTLNFEDLSSVAPELGLEPRTL